MIRRFLMFALLAATVSAQAETSEDLPARAATEDVNSAAVRTRPSLAPSKDLLFNGWGVTPAGEHVACGDLALKMVVAPDKKALVAVCAGYNKVGVNVTRLDGTRQTKFIPLREVFNGLAFGPDGKRFYVSGGDSGLIYVFRYADGEASLEKEIRLGAADPLVFLAGVAVDPVSGRLYVCNEANHEIWALAPRTLAVEKTIGVGQHPHSCVLGRDGRHLYVSNWGSRSVSIIDTRRGHRVRDLAVGIRPNDMVLAPDGRLFVACSGDNMVHVIGTAGLEKAPPDASSERPLWQGTRELISTALYPQSPEGSTPCGVAVSPDGHTLFVANADNNAVMVVDISGRLMEQAKEQGETVSLVNGFIPTGWYPTAVAVSPDGNFLLVANGKGLASRASYPAQGASPTKLHRGPSFDHPGKIFEGSISFIAKPSAAQMTAYTAQVRRNSPYHPEHLRQTPLRGNGVIPSKASDPCPIKYVLYIIKENRTYDQVLGDMTDAGGRPIGNGDPRLTIYGAKVTPNQHQIAREYVLLDNLYCNSEVSVDGHSWTDAAIATDFNQRSWIISYSGHGKLPGNEEMAVPVAGYLWDSCRRNGLSFRNYGEGAQRVPPGNRGRWLANLRDRRDMKAVDFWIEDLKAAERSDDLPRFTIMSLGENHTAGTTPGANTPEACVGSNDLALGKIVAAASRSKFWKEMAILVIEDDAQNGPDHVDAHRTVGFVISPWCKRGLVDHTLYTTASMVRTIELILNLPPLTQYDAGATPMFHCFGDHPQVTPYTVRMPQVDLEARNTPRSPGAKRSSQMDFREYDLAPEDELNRILWLAAKGPDVPYPTPIHRALFTKPLDGSTAALR